MLRKRVCPGQHRPCCSTPCCPEALRNSSQPTGEVFLHYGRIYKTFIRPLLATRKVYHHAPVTATEGVDSGRLVGDGVHVAGSDEGLATVVRLSGVRPSKTGPEAYRLILKGLHPHCRYAVTRQLGATEVIPGAGRRRLDYPSSGQPALELLLFEAK